MESSGTSDGRLRRYIGAVVFVGYTQLPQYAKLLLDEVHENADAASTFGDESVCGSMGKHQIVLIACASSELRHGLLVSMLLDLKEKLTIGFMLFVGRCVSSPHERAAPFPESVEQLRTAKRMSRVDQAIASREEGPQHVSDVQLRGVQIRRRGHLQSPQCGRQVPKALFTSYAWDRVVALEQSLSEAILQDIESLGLTVVLLEVGGSLQELNNSIISRLCCDLQRPGLKVSRAPSANAAAACVTRLLTIVPGGVRTAKAFTSLQAGYINTASTNTQILNDNSSDDHADEHRATTSAETTQMSIMPQVLEGRIDSTDSVKSAQSIMLRPAEALTTRLTEALSSRDSLNSTEIRADSSPGAATIVQTEAVSVSHTSTLSQSYTQNYIAGQARAHLGNVNHYHHYAEGSASRSPSLSDTTAKWAPTAITGIMAGYVCKHYPTKQSSTPSNQARDSEATRCEESRNQAVTTTSMSGRKTARCVTTDALQKKSSSSRRESHEMTVEDRTAHGMLAYLNTRASQTDLQLVQKRKHEFFSFGRVFATHLDAEQDSNMVRHVKSGVEVCLDLYVVVIANAKDALGREDERFCYASRISTYEGRGVGKPGLIKAEHGVVQPIFSRDKTNVSSIDIGEDEQAKRYEKGMCPTPIKFRVMDDWESADNMLRTRSRVNYGHIFKFSKSEPVLSIGEVHTDSLPWLMAQFNEVQERRRMPYKCEINDENDQSDESELEEEDESDDEVDSSLQERYRESALNSANAFRRLRQTYVAASDDQLLSFMARELCKSQPSLTQQQAYDKIREQVKYVNDSVMTTAR